MIVSVMKKQNLHVKKTKPGTEHNVFQRNGFAMAILIVLTELMKIPHYIIVQHHNRAVKINLHVKMVDASTRDGSVITITIVVMVLMKVNSVIHNTKLVQH